MYKKRENEMIIEPNAVKKQEIGYEWSIVYIKA